MVGILETQLNQTQVVKNAIIPKEGPRVYPVILDFAANTTWNIDLLLVVQRGFMSFVQTLFVDNSANASSVTITSQGGIQSLTIPPQSQAYLPILSPNQPKLIFTSTGGVTVNIAILNVPMPAQVWSVAGPLAVDGGNLTVVAGALQTEDVNLAGIISSNRLLTLNSVQGNGDTIFPNFRATLSSSQDISTTGDKTLITGSPGWFLTGLVITPSYNFAANASGTVVTVKETGTGNQGTLFTFAITANTVGRPIIVPDILYIGKATASPLLVASVNNAPATGSVTVTAMGGTTATVQ